MVYIPKVIQLRESELEEKLRLAQIVGDTKTVERVNNQLSSVYLVIENRQTGGLEQWK